MDTIFVKSVREKGPAHQAGLCTGRESRATRNMLICICKSVWREIKIKQIDDFCFFPRGCPLKSRVIETFIRLIYLHS